MGGMDRAGGPEIETVETDSFAMEYFRFGQGEKAFVILPGLAITSVMESAAAIRNAYKDIAREYTVYVFDRRKDLPVSYPIREMARDTANALKELGLERVSLFGASQGGMMALEIAIRYPELVDKLVIGSTAAKIPEKTRSCLDSWIALARERDAARLYLAFGKALYPEKVFEEAKDLLLDLAAKVTEEDLQRFVVLAEGFRGFDLTGELENIRCPVLAIGDRDDRVTGAEAMEAIASCFASRSEKGDGGGFCPGRENASGPAFELYMYEGYGHAVYDLAPDYRKRILEFLRCR